MKVLFLQDVPNVAKVGEVKDVANGYGRNFLLPRGLAVLATASELGRLQQAKEAESRRQVRVADEVHALAAKLEGMSLTLRAKAGEQDRLFGSITAQDIALELERVLGHPFDRRRIGLSEPIKQVGPYEVTIRLSRELTPTIRILVEGEMP